MTDQNEHERIPAGIDQYITQGAAMVAAQHARRQQVRQRKFDTLAVHGMYGMEDALANQGSINEPLMLTSAQHFENSDHMAATLSGQMPGWAYTRIANPTIGYLEETLALLEGYGYAGEVSACATGSGMAAVFMATNPFLTLDPSQSSNGTLQAARPNIVATPRCYGGTFHLFTERYAAERGIEVRWVREPDDLAAWAALIDANTRFLYGEMPSNPTLHVLDIKGLADLAHTYYLPLIIDSTVATPALLRPICHGADIVVHSVSKSMTISGFAIAGAVIARHNIPSRVGTDEMRANFAHYVKLSPFRDHGPAISPFSALMILNDLRTLRSRMDRLSQNAMQVARFLEQHPAVAQVFYPGLASSAGHSVAECYMWLADGADDYGAPVNRYGHMLAFAVRGGDAAAYAVMDRLHLIWRATDLGRIKSIATIPAISTHQQQGAAGRELAQIPPGLIRLNVGGEHPADVLADLEQALAAI